MAEQTIHTYVTDVGNTKMAAAAAKGEKVDVIDFAVGDGGGAPYTPTTDMTALKNETWRGAVASYKLNDTLPNVINVDGIVPHDVGGWTIREGGIFDADGDLIAVCNTPDIAKVIPESGATGQVLLHMQIALNNTDAISFVIDPNVVTASQSFVELTMKADNEDPNAHGGVFATKDELDKKADISPNGKIPLEQLPPLPMLDANGQIPADYLGNIVSGGLKFQNVWDATKGLDGGGGAIPAPAPENEGYYWVTEVAGTFNGETYTIGDLLSSNGFEYVRIPDFDAVHSVNGKEGAVVLDATDVGADPAGSAAQALLDAKAYLDEQLEGIENGSY